MKHPIKYIFSILLALTLLFSLGCGAEYTTPHSATTLPVDNEMIAAFAKIATDAMERPNMLEMRQNHLAYSGSETQVPSIDWAAEFVLSPQEASGTPAIHLYLIRILAVFLDVDTQTAWDAVTVVYDCDTGNTYLSCDNLYPGGSAAEAENTKDYYLAVALSVDNLDSDNPNGWSLYRGDEAHAVFSAEELETLNSEFHPSGWDYRSECIIEIDPETNLPVGTPIPVEEYAAIVAADSQQEDTASIGDGSEAGSPADSRPATATAGSSEAITGSPAPANSTEEIISLAIDVLNRGLESGKFGAGELIDATLLAAKVYTGIVYINDGSFEARLLYLWLNGNPNCGNDYAGQVLIDLDTGAAMFACDYDDSRTNLDNPADIMLYYFWLGPNAIDYTRGYLMNDTEALTSLTDDEVLNLQAGIKAK